MSHFTTHQNKISIKTIDTLASRKDKHFNIHNIWLEVIKPRNIFLVEDDEDDQQFFIEAIKKIDTSIVLNISKNGVEALTKLNNMDELPDVIFMDINMPLMNGFACLTELKKQIRFKTIPVVILSTTNNPAEAELAVMLGASFFLSKPSHFPLLKKNIARIVDLYYPIPIMEAFISN